MNMNSRLMTVAALACGLLLSSQLPSIAQQKPDAIQQMGQPIDTSKAPQLQIVKPDKEIKAPGTKPTDDKKPATPGDTNAAPADNKTDGADTKLDPSRPIPGIPLPGGMDPKMVKKLQELHATLTDTSKQPKPEELEAIYTEVWGLVGQRYFDETKLANWHLWANKYKGKLNTVADLNAALTEMVGSLGDRWTKFTSIEKMARSAAIYGSGIVPLGMSLAQQADGTYKVEVLMYGSTAWNVNRFRSGDVVKTVKITRATDDKSAAPKVDTYNLAGMPKEQVDEMLMAKKGSKAELTIVHDGVEETIELAFDETADAPFEVRLLPGKVGYVRVPTFGTSPEEGQQLTQAINQTMSALYKATNGDMRGLVLDLRGNTGGLVEFAKQLAGIFIEKGTFIQTRERDGRIITEQKEQFAAPTAADFANMPPEIIPFVASLKKMPMVVLVNGSSASSSEILSGTLKDNKRAVVIGNQTFGKAVAFIDMPVGDKDKPLGELQITIMHYLTPNGDDLSHKGLTPDLVVDQPRGVAVDAQLAAGVAVIQAANDRTTDPTGLTAQAQQQGDSTTSGDSLILWGVGLGLIALVAVLSHRHARIKQEQAKKDGKSKSK
ncbi:MAG: hypothetical protein J0H83_17610 [Candidatus Melainabacteria bacterium]|jgi:carboxyl-terminal processing protease|nr:hypothetical protein [Candidatus Melainabacteria bacterium]MBX9673685.1 hypothetical protein [Candidatus Obscuribacterales bacterium]